MTREQVASVAFSILLVSSVIAGVAFIGTQPLGDADHDGTAAAASSGEVIATGGDGGVTLRDATTGDLIHNTSWGVQAVDLEWHPSDGELLAVARGGEGDVVVWNASSKQIEHEINVGYPAYAVSWRPDGSQIAVAGDEVNNNVQIWTPGGTSPDTNLSGHTGNPRALDWESSGLASGANEDTVFIWDAVNATEKTNFSAHTGGVFDVKWSHDESSLATTGEDNTAIIWDTGSWTASTTYTGHSNWVRPVSWSPDDSQVVTGSNDNTAHVWNASDGTRSHNFTLGYLVYGASFSSTGDEVAIADGDTSGTLEIRDPSTGDKLGSVTGTDNIRALEYGGTLESTSDAPVSGNVTGRFTDQYGEPVADATIYTTEYNQSKSIPVGSRTLDGIMQDPTPQAWKDQINELSSFDESQFSPDFTGNEFNEKRVLMHTEEDWAADDTPDKRLVSDDILPGDPPSDVPVRPVVEDGDEVVFSCWQPDTRRNQDDVDSSIPGAETTDCSVTIELINPLGNPEWSRTEETQPQFKVADTANSWDADDWTWYGPAKVHEFLKVDELDPGVYRVYPESGGRQDALYYVVGDGGGSETLEPDITNWDSACANDEIDKQWHNKVCDQLSDITTPRTTTNASGYYGLNVNADLIDSVLITGVKKGDMASPDETLTVAAVRSEFKSAVKQNFRERAPGGWDPSAYTREEFREYCREMPSVAADVGMPVQGSTVSPVPNDDADIRGVRAAPPEIPSAFRECAAVNLVEDILNDNLGFLDSGFLDDLENLDPFEKFEDLLPLLTADPELRDAVERATGVELDSDDPADYTDREARKIVREGGQRLDDGTTGGGGGGSGAPTVGDGQETIDETAETISHIWPVSGVDDWSEAELLIRLDWSNGTTTTLTESNEYVTVEENTFGADQVRLENYPVGQNDPAVVTPRLNVATPSGTDGGENPGVRNPTFDGTIPGLQHVRVSSMQPGPSETVTLDVKGDDGLDGLKRVEVTHPDGSTETVTPDASGTAKFTTTGAGTHRLALVVTNPSGTEFTEVLRVQAGQQTAAQPPSVRAATGSTGRWAVASDGMQAASVEVSNGASEVTVIGLLNSRDTDRVLIDTSSASIAPAATHHIELRYGANEQRLDRTVNMILRQPPTNDGALYYRENKPVPADEQGTEGTVRRQANATVWDTFSAGDGTLTTATINDPGIFERVWHRIRLSSPIDPGPIGDTPVLVHPIEGVTPA